MAFNDKGTAYRAFHTEGLGTAQVAENDGQIYMFLYASHDGVQELVGATGKATCLALDERTAERENLVKRLGIRQLWRDAWGLQRVRECYNRNQQAFTTEWNAQSHWIPNWKCPEDLFFWPERAVTLDPLRVTGKKRLLAMFNSYTEVGPNVARRVMEHVPADARTDAWLRIWDEIEHDLSAPIRSCCGAERRDS